MTENITPSDIYIQHLVFLANAANKLHDGLEKVLSIEEQQQASFLDALTEIESWLDGVATRQEKRLEYAITLSKEPGA